MVVVCGGWAACGGGEAAPVAPADVAVVDGEADTVAPDAADGEASADAVDASVADTSPPLTASGYCEATAATFCGFYLRCGRMAVPDEATCLTVFAEVCNAVYEPQYAALEARGMLALSASDVAACAAHLETVECALQPGDLDGPCRGMWQGLVPEGGECSYGIENLVCDAQSVCVLGLDFCGTCRKAVEVGEACDAELRCHDDAACVEGVCVARARPTESCSNAKPCRVGASCVDRVCVAPEVVSVGASCDQVHRCPYKSACVSGTCVETVLLGETCSAAVPCASGECASGVCVPSAPFASGCLD